MYKNNTAIWYNKACRIKQLIPAYVNIRATVTIQDAKEQRMQPSAIELTKC